MLPLTNETFLDTLLGAQKFIGLGDPWVCSFPDWQCQWNGRLHSTSQPIENDDSNNFFCISLMKLVNDITSRKKENFAGMLCVALDDIGTKAKPPALEPSWKFETSPGNEQWGYILETPLMDANKADEIQKAVIAAGYCDAGAGGPSTRYMRLPVGSNCKPEHVKNNKGKPWRICVKEWRPDKKFSTEDIIEGLNLKFEHDKTPSSPNTMENTFSVREDDSELIRKILSSESYHAPTLILAARYQSRGMKRNEIIETLTGFLQGTGDTSERAKERLRDIPHLVDSAIKKFQAEPKKFSIVAASEFCRGEPPAWLIKNILPQKGLAMIYGESGAGKSFFALDILGAIAQGVRWQNLTVKKAKVLYIPAEGVGGARKRIQAYALHHKIDIETLGINIIADNAPNIFGDDTEPLIHAIEQAGGAEVIALDTLAQVTAGANENAGEDMGLVMSRCQEIAKRLGALVILIHHSGKDPARGARGWSGLKAPLDTEISISRHGNLRQAKITKQKDGEEGQQFAFELFPIPLDEDEDGELITSCVLKYASLSAPYENKKLGKWQKAVFDAAQELCGIGNTSIRVTEIIDKAYTAYPHDAGAGAKPKRDSRRESAKRALDDLIACEMFVFDRETISFTQSRNLPQFDDCGIAT